MKQLLNTELTRHVEVYRADRVQHIINDIGLGQVVKEVYRRGHEKALAGQAGVYICITDTGITIIKDELKQKIITMYVTTFRELVQCYNGTNRIPSYLRKKVDRNQIKFIKAGKTIWR